MEARSVTSGIRAVFPAAMSTTPASFYDDYSSAPPYYHYPPQPPHQNPNLNPYPNPYASSAPPFSTSDYSPYPQSYPHFSHNPDSTPLSFNPTPPPWLPPPPVYGFHNLDRRTIVLADSTVRSYFALPSDYIDFPPPPQHPRCLPFGGALTQDRDQGVSGQLAPSPAAKQEAKLVRLEPLTSCVPQHTATLNDFSASFPMTAHLVGTHTTSLHDSRILVHDSMDSCVEKHVNLNDEVFDDDFVVCSESLSNAHRVIDENPERDKVTWATTNQCAGIIKADKLLYEMGLISDAPSEVLWDSVWDYVMVEATKVVTSKEKDATYGALKMDKKVGDSTKMATKMGATIDEDQSMLEENSEVDESGDKGCWFKREGIGVFCGASNTRSYLCLPVFKGIKIHLSEIVGKSILLNCPKHWHPLCCDFLTKLTVFNHKTKLRDATSKLLLTKLTNEGVTLFNPLVYFNDHHKTATKVDNDIAGPEAHEGHSVVVVGKRLFVFGGCGRSANNEEVYYNDLYILNTETFVWKKAITSGLPPSPHTLVWRELSTSGQLLPPRGGHYTVAIGKNLFVFWGFTDAQTLYNDLYMLDVDTGIWTKVITTGDEPSARFSVAGDCLDPAKDGVLVFVGGCNKSLEGLDDMYYLNTGLVRECERRLENLSFRKQLQLTCHDQSPTPIHDRALVPVGVDGFRHMTVPFYGQPGEQVYPLNQCAAAKKIFQAKVIESLSDGYTIETVIDGKPLRGVLFSNKSELSIPVATNSTRNQEVDGIMSNGDCGSTMYRGATTILEDYGLVTSAATLQTFDLVTMKPDEVDFTASVVLEPKLEPNCDDATSGSTELKSEATWCNGIVLWFETGFTSRFCKEKPSVLSTSPVNGHIVHFQQDNISEENGTSEKAFVCATVKHCESFFSFICQARGRTCFEGAGIVMNHLIGDISHWISWTRVVILSI